MRLLAEIVRAATIAVFSAVCGFGTLVFLDRSRIWSGQKELFFLLGFVVAITTGFALFRIWPSTPQPRDPKKPPPA